MKFTNFLKNYKTKKFLKKENAMLITENKLLRKNNFSIYDTRCLKPMHFDVKKFRTCRTFRNDEYSFLTEGHIRRILAQQLLGIVMENLQIEKMKSPEQGGIIVSGELNIAVKE